tara:strand:+ start:43810 stop:44349 length:540 start_codon:yes stop_codon:yes gene_type:complete
MDIQTILFLTAFIVIAWEQGRATKRLERTNKALKVRVKDLEDDVAINEPGQDDRTNERLSAIEATMATDDEFDVFDRRIQMLELAAGGFWKTKDGFVYMINTMDSDHLRNCLKGWAKGETKNSMLRVLRARHVAAQFTARDLGDELTALGGDLVSGAAKRPGGWKPTYGGPADSGNHGL